jgi:hypothetical protein
MKTIFAILFINLIVFSQAGQFGSWSSPKDFNSNDEFQEKAS